MTQLKLSNVDNIYVNGVCVLKDINLDIHSGELLVFVRSQLLNAVGNQL